jgi:hypothetical protein
LAAVFSSRKNGTLILVYPEISLTKKEDAADVLGPSALASFRALTQGLLAAAHNDKYTTIGFATTDAGNETAFASFIFKNIDDTGKRSNGKLNKFGKFNLFK